jgi:hypothetical protein
MGFKTVNLIDTIDNIIDSMRITGTYSAIYDGEYSILTTNNSFIIDDTIIVNAVNYVIKEATPTTLKVKGDVSGFTEWKNAAPYYDKGHILEIANTLTSKDQDARNTGLQKYPLFILALDITGIPNKTLRTIDYNNVSILIVNKTESSYKVNDRREHNFTPILTPLYEQFINKLSHSRLTNNGESIPFIAHEATDRYFWGSDENKNSITGKNILNDYLDAIDIRKLNIKVINNNC